MAAQVSGGFWLKAKSLGFGVPGSRIWGLRMYVLELSGTPKSGIQFFWVPS